MKSMLMIAMLLSSSTAFASAGIGGCTQSQVIGSASVSTPGFAKRIRSLRVLCAAAAQRYSAADIVWNNSERAYQCVVGNFCNNR